MWEYMDVIRRYADETCSNHLVSLATAIDKILGTPLSKPLKSLFGLADLKSDYDFVSTIEVIQLFTLQQNAQISVRGLSESGKARTGILKLAAPYSMSTVLH